MARKRRTGGEKRKAIGRGIWIAAAAAVLVVVGAGAALAAAIPGTDRGEVLRGTDHADTIHGYGGADLVYGYGGRDTVWGGNEAGWGDKVLGGTAGDHLIGQQGDDAIYGQGDDDRLDGQKGDDLLVGGAGRDTLNAGPGADRINARDGRRDVIQLCGSGPSDVVYYDRGLDVFATGCARQAGEDAAGMGATEAARATEAKLSAAKPPAGLFAHTGRVLVEHEGRERLVAEKDLGQHLGHGDEILDPTGRATAEQGR